MKYHSPPLVPNCMFDPSHPQFSPTWLGIPWELLSLPTLALLVWRIYRWTVPKCPFKPNVLRVLQSAHTRSLCQPRVYCSTWTFLLVQPPTSQPAELYLWSSPNYSHCILCRTWQLMRAELWGQRDSPVNTHLETPQPTAAALILQKERDCGWLEYFELVSLVQWDIRALSISLPQRTEKAQPYFMPAPK